MKRLQDSTQVQGVDAAANNRLNGDQRADFEQQRQQQNASHNRIRMN